MLRKQKMFLFAVCTVVLCIFFSPTIAFGFTTISANIDTDTTWSIDASPYLISQSIHITDTATLMIQPGVQVLVAPGAGIAVDGSILAQGTTESGISFESSTPDTLWGGISLSILASGDFNYVDFAHTHTAISADDAELSITQSSFTAVQNPAQITFATRFVHSGNTFLQTGIAGWNIAEGATVQDISLLGGDGTYYISGRSTISSDTTGSIAPGVQIVIAPHIDMSVHGSIQSIGTADTPINIDGMNSRIYIYGGTADFLHTHITNTDVSLYTATATFLHSTSVDARAGIAGFESTVRIENSSVTNTLYDSISLYGNSSLTMKDAAIVSSQNTALYITDHTTANMHNVRIDLTSGTAIFMTNQSTLFATDVQIHNAQTGLSIFTQSTATLKNIEIGSFGDRGILMGGTSKTTITDSEISHGSIGIIFFDHSSLDAARIRIHDVDHGIVMNAQNYTDAKISVRDSNIYNTSDYALRLFDIGDQADIHNNSIYNTDGKNVVYVGSGIDLSRNWWGSKDGPDPESIVPDPSLVQYTPWLRHNPKDTRVPVIIIPGITGTRLLKAYDNNEEIWPDINRLINSPFDSFLDDLSLLPNGTENSNKQMSTGDIIRDLKTVDVFESLISDLEAKNGYIENQDLFVFPYDWRFDSKTSADKLKEKIDQVLEQTGYDNVHIISHSMGGLVTKRYIAEYDDSKIDKIFFVGTPHLGAPKAFKALMYGDNMGYTKYLLNFLSPSKLKEISQNMPSAYELLPSEQFGSYIKFNAKELDISETKKLMVQQGRNLGMFSFANTLHSLVDTPPLYTSAKVYDFAGCSTKTIQSYNITKSGFFPYFEVFNLLYGQGDETVPLKSAEAMNQGQNYYSNVGTHGELPSIVGVRTTITNIIAGRPIITDDTFSNTKNICAQSGKSVEIHSPVMLDIYDDQGRHTGPTPDGGIEYNIPNVSYNIIGEQKFAYLPDGPNYRVVQRAEDTGTYDMYIHSIGTDDSISSSAYFTSLPISTENMSGEFAITPTSTTYTVSLDQDGDGAPDASVASKDKLEIPVFARVSSRSNGRPTVTQKEDIVVPISKKIPTLQDIKEKVSIAKKDIPKIVPKKVYSQYTGIGVQDSKEQTGDIENPTIKKSITQRWYLRLRTIIKNLFIR